MNIEEARKKIKDAIENKSSKLNLSSFLDDEKLNNEDLGKLIDEIKELTSLQYLNLQGNQISDISTLSELTSLQTLSVSVNRISGISTLSKLTSLESLGLGGNQISDISSLGELTSLRSLDLQRNQISDISSLGKLTSLQSLNLRGNQALQDKIPEEILDDYENPRKILNYYANIADKETRPLNEAKIVVVGEADFGKTLLIRRLIYGDYIDTKSTTGIKIERWRDVVNNNDVRLNVWDFGGQEIMHSTHQFFFTNRTIYILVINARQNEDKNKTEEWLKRIQSFGGDSPVIVVGNKLDQNQRDTSQDGQGYFDISNRRELEEKFTNIRGFYGVCSNVNVEGYDDKFKEFKDALLAEIENLDDIHKPFPLEWFSVKKDLEEMSNNDIPYITNHDYLQRCFKREVKDEISKNTIREFLNEVGTVIYFEDLPERMVFNPEWITQGVYAIIDNPKIIQNKGELEISQVEKILTPKGYKKDEHKYILDLMRKFKLCVDIEQDTRFLIPDLLLQAEEPSTGEWKNTLSFHYKYETYLKNVFTQFVVRMFPYIHKRTWWRNGVVLEHEGSRALVKFYSSDKEVKIKIEDDSIKKRQNLLAIIRKEFKEIHSTFAVLRTEELAAHPNIKIPDEITGKDKELLKDYDELLKMEQDGETEIYVKELRKKLPISEWLDGVESAEKRRLNWTFESREYYEEQNDSSEKREFLIKQTNINNELETLKERKEKLESEKETIDIKAEVWASVVKVAISLLLFVGISYFIYWCYKNWETVQPNAEAFFIVAVFVFGVLGTVFYLLTKKKIDKETTDSSIDEKMHNFLYWKEGFALSEYQNIEIEINQKESDLKALKQ